MYFLNVTVHVFAALFWVGGMFFFATVGAPVLRTIEPPELRSRLFGLLGERFRRVGWTALGILIVTGVLNLHLRGLLTSALSDGVFWTTSYGRWLAVKLGAVGAMIVVQSYHDFVAGPAATKLDTGSPAMLAARGRAVVLARVSGILGIIIVIAAVRLARGG